MLNLSASVKIYVGLEPCDLRKSYNGLQSLVREGLSEDPGSGALYLFTNKRRDRLKVFYADATGFWVMCKRLEEGRFSWPCAVNESACKLRLTPRALALLLDGIELKEGHRKAWYER